MEGRTCRWMLMAMAIALLCAIANAQNVDNIDILEPIIRYSPASAEDLFGFSTVLHQVSEPPVSGDDLAQTVQRTRIIVGAPRGTFPGGLQLTDPGLAAEDNTGLVYMCPVGPGQCDGVRGICNTDDSQTICSIDDDRDGDFDGRLFDQAPNAEARPSCSASGTAPIENKEGQFMGSTLFSDGDTFIACAPLWGYTVGQTTQNQPRGRCYWSDRDLQDFHYLQPCVPLDRGASTAGLFSYCMSGWGVTVVNVAGTRLFAVGNPGQETYRGFVSFRDENYLSEEIPMPCPDERPDFTFSDSNDTLSDILQGFQVVSGYITRRRGTGTANVIASEPRYDGIIYFGRVAVFIVDDNPSLTGDRPVPENITAEGEQLGEFFGYSMVAADLNGDGWDELVVGAPMYTKVDAGDNGIERGRVYVFPNTGGNMSSTPIILENMAMRGRFGTSVVNLGDADNDGDEDIAIGAPYVPGTGNNTGAVYVYYGRDSLDTFGQQTPYMIGSDNIVNSVDGLNELQTFGFSLGSGVDIDGNGYNDLVVGAYQSQAVVLLRALPVADIYVRFEGQAEPVEFDQNNCNLNEVNYPCFTVTISANYSGRQLSGDRDVVFTVTEEVLNDEQRLIFDSPSNDSVMVTVTISDTMVVSQNLTVYSRNMEDLQNPASLIQAFRLRVTPEEIFRPAPVGVDGNQIISDFSAFPRIRTNGITQTEVTTINTCGSDSFCQADLGLEKVGDTRLLNSTGNEMDSFIAGAVDIVELNLQYENQGAEEAQGVSIVYTRPSVFSDVTLKDGGVTICCEQNGNRFTCPLQTSLSTSADPRQLTVRLTVDQSRVEGDIAITFRLTVRPDIAVDTDLSNNNYTESITVMTEADVFVVTAFSRTSVSYTAEAPMEPVIEARVLGPPVSLRVTVGNTGTTSIRNTSLTIFFPAQPSPNQYYLYPAAIRSDLPSGVGVTCSETGINPQDLEVEMHSEMRRRRHEANAAGVRKPRQATQGEVDSLNCTASQSSCFMTSCSITNLGNRGVDIFIDALVDERFFGSQSADQYSLTAYTVVSIEDDFFLPEIGQGNANNRDEDTLALEQITGTPTICIAEFMDTIFGSYSWPETTVGDTVDLRCELGSASMDDSETNATRMCGEEGVWMDSDFSQCADSFDLLEDMNITSDNYEQVILETSVSVEIASANPADQNEDNIAAISSILDASAVLLVEDPTIVVDVQTVNETVMILDILQEWNATVVALESANIVESFESIVSSYAEQENFTELVVEGENLAFVVERLEVQTLIESGRGFSLAEDPENGTLNVNTEGGADNFMELAPDELATAFLPPSLFTLFGSSDNLGVFFSLYQTAVLFSLGGEAQVVGPGGSNRMVGSPVVAATVARQEELRDLPDPVSILLRLNNLDAARIITAITCVSYDFDAADGRGNWTSEGCVAVVIDDGDGVLDDEDIVNCSCNHLTNFAVLVDICSRTGSCGISSEAQLALDVISIIGVVFSLIGIIITIFTLLVFKKLRNRDVTKFHVQLCIALFCMLLVFGIGIDQNKVSGGCVTVSILIHYFTLVAVMWMGAEAVLMFQKLVIIFVRITTRYIVILSLVCWLVPIIPAVIPAAIDWESVVSFTDSGDIDFCFIGDTAVFFGAFLGPILTVMAFNFFIICNVVFVLIRHTISTQRLKGEKKIDMKIAIRLLISIAGVMFLFGLTWVFGALTVAEASLTFQILFALFNSFQGFFIFLFFCVISKDAREAWKGVFSFAQYTFTTLHPSRAKNTSSIPVPKSKSTTATLMRTGDASSLPQSEAASEYNRLAELAAFEPGSTSTFGKSSTEETNVDSVNVVKNPAFELEKEKESSEEMKEKEALQQASEASGLQVGRESPGLKARVRRYSTKYVGKHHVESYEVDFEDGDDDQTGFRNAPPA